MLELRITARASGEGSVGVSPLPVKLGNARATASGVDMQRSLHASIVR